MPVVGQQIVMSVHMLSRSRVKVEPGTGCDSTAIAMRLHVVVVVAYGKGLFNTAESSPSYGSKIVGFVFTPSHAHATYTPDKVAS
jgi:hypothetical protein